MSISVQLSSNYLPAINELSSHATHIETDSQVGPPVRSEEGFPADGSSKGRRTRSMDRLEGRAGVIDSNITPRQPNKMPHHHYKKPHQPIESFRNFLQGGLIGKKIKELKQALKRQGDDISSQIGEKRAAIEAIDKDSSKSPGQKKDEQHKLYMKIDYLIKQKQNIDEQIASLEPGSDSKGSPSRTRFPAGTRYG